MAEMGFDSNVSPPKRLSKRRRGFVYERKRWVKNNGRYEFRKRTWNNGLGFNSKAGYSDVVLNSESFLSHSARRRHNLDVSKAMIFLFAILIMFTFVSSSFIVETKTMIGDNEYIQRVGLASKYNGGYYWEFDGSRLMSKLGNLETKNLFEEFIAFELDYINKDDYKGDSKVGETVFAVVSAILNAVILIFNVVLSILDIIMFFIQELITVIEILVIIIKDGFVYMEPYKIPVGG